MMTSYFRIALGSVLLLFGNLPVIAQQKDPGATFHKLMSAPAEYDDNFTYAVMAVSNEQKSLISRNYIVAGSVETIKWLQEHPERRGNRLFRLDGKKDKPTKLPDPTSFGFVPNSTKIWIMSCFGTVQFWDSRTHQRLDTRFPHALRSECSGPNPAISPDGSVMATQTNDTLQIWDLRTLKLMSSKPEHDWVHDMGISSDGKWLFTRGSRQLKILDPKNGKLVAGPFRHDLIAQGFTYFPKNNQLATFENNSQKEAAWKSVATIRSGKGWSDVRRVEMVGHTREARWIDDKHFLVVADKKSPGQTAPFSYGRKLVYVVSLATDKPEIQTILQYRWIPNAAVAPDGKYIVATTVGTTSCWKLGDQEPIWTRNGKSGVSFGDEGWVLLHRDRSAIVCSLASGDELWRKDQVITARVQGSHVWLCDKNGVEVWRYQK